MEEEKVILCECGHPLSFHATGCGECYSSTRRTEKKMNHLKKEIKVKCIYTCYCKEFKFLEDSAKSGEAKK